MVDSDFGGPSSDDEEGSDEDAEAEDDVEFEQQGGAYPLTGLPY